jgi:hypothetical protein
MRMHRKITFTTSTLYPGEAEEVKGREGYAGEEEDVPAARCVKLVYKRLETSLSR